MNPDRWRRVERIFFEAAERTGSDREAYLLQECAGDSDLQSEVLALLASDAEAGAFVEGKIQEGLLDFSKQLDAPRTLRAGPYLLTSVLGRGGMGTVYLGQRDDGQYEGQVAVKLVRHGMETGLFLDRFKRERQALASLHHPNIASLLDSGAADDGSPYIVMELVDGIPITEFRRREDLSVPALLILFRKVCDAVAHAHRLFIVHRDLKPGNILIEPSGNPKLLDFGICKLLDPEAGASETIETTQLMTPDYASPEQVRGDPITVSSDIYSLGAVLYELLARVRPHRIDKMTPQAIARAVCEYEIPAPSRAAEDPVLARQLRGDLDTILLKALQKDPLRRYPSVESFSDDIRRVLESEPVLARPDTAYYRVSKFVHRNRAVTVVAALLVVSLTGGLIGYARQAALARRSAASSRALASAILFDIHDQVRDLPGALKARENIVRIGLTYLDGLAAGAGSDQDLRLDLAAGYLRMGEILGGVMGSYTGDTDQALASFRNALASLENLPASSRAIRLRMDVHLSIGRLLDARSARDATAHFDQGIEAAAGSSDVSLRASLAGLYAAKAVALRNREDRQSALVASLRAASLYQELVEANPSDISLRGDLAANSAGAATLLRSMNRLPEARRKLEIAVEQWDDLVRRQPANVGFQRNRMLAYSHLGDLLGNPGYGSVTDTAGAQKAFDAMLAAARHLYDSNPGDQGATISYGMALGRVASLPLGEPAARIALFDRSARLLDTALRRDPTDKVIPANLASYRETEGDFLAASGRTADARLAWRRGLEVLERHPTPLPGATRVRITTLHKLAVDAARNGDSIHAISMARQAVTIADGAGSDPAAPVALQMYRPRAWIALGSVHQILGNTAESRRWLLLAVTEARRLSVMTGFHIEHKSVLRMAESLFETTAK